MGQTRPCRVDRFIDSVEREAEAEIWRGDGPNTPQMDSELGMLMYANGAVWKGELA